VPAGGLRLRVLDASSARDLEAWLHAWRRWPEREPMAHPEYVRLFAGRSDRAIAVFAEAEGVRVLFPLVLRPLAAEPWAARGEDRWDASSPYGYGGPFAWGSGDLDRAAAAFWRGYEGWCARARVVCTFARLSLFPEQLAPPRGVEVRGANVVVPLAGGRDALWRGYDRDLRRRIRVARREGVAAEVDRDGTRLAEFHAVYLHTMRRRAAEGWYHFERGFFERMVERLRGQLAFVHAVRDGRVLSSEIVLLSARGAYAFLGGTLADAFRLQPNVLLRHATAEWAMAEGKERYVLGGGRGPDDSLLRYKRAFAPGADVPFRTASLVHDELAYHALARGRAAAARAGGEPWTPRPAFFPAYRG
jgi:hypothetical protein